MTSSNSQFNINSDIVSSTTQTPGRGIGQFIDRIEQRVFNYPKTILGLILLITLFFAWQIPAVKMYTDFADLLPQQHPYIELHNDIKESFGGANVIVVGVEVTDGDIFENQA